MGRFPRRLAVPLLAFLIQGGRVDGAAFIRGDLDSSGRITLTDAVRLFRFLFGWDPAVPDCLDSADVDNNGVLEITDGIRILHYLFEGGCRGGPGIGGIPLFFSPCQSDTGQDPLGCESFEPCNPQGIFFCLDNSGLMSERTSILRFVERDISSLSHDDQIGLVYFDSGVAKFPVTGLPAGATSEIKAAAIAFMTRSTGQSSCPGAGLLAALGMAEASTVRNRRIVLIIDGAATCPGAEWGQYAAETLAEVTARNTSRIPIHILRLGRASHDGWLRQLAEENEGIFGWEIR